MSKAVCSKDFVRAILLDPLKLLVCLDELSVRCPPLVAEERI